MWVEGTRIYRLTILITVRAIQEDNMIVCCSCGAERDGKGYWTGGDANCGHFYRQAEPPEHLTNELKLMLTVYSPSEILEAARRLAGG